MDQVNTQATFALDDKFDRERYAEMCMTLIKNHPADRGACTIAVDAPWGVGKSTFLHMWINDLNAKNDALIAGSAETPVDTKQLTLPIYYNAWENDFFDSALTPILFKLCAMVDRTPAQNTPTPKPDVIRKLVSGSLGLLAAVGVKLATKDDITAQAAGFVAEKTTGAIISGLMHRADAALEIPEDGSIGDLYDKQLQIYDAFRNGLTELAQAYSGVYIFIDELDRCKPSFAIETLEIIKHFFNIPNIAFVFAVDQLQLCRAIAGRYGNEMDAGGYFSKFIDHHLMLPKPTARQMIRMVNASVKLSAMQEEDFEKIFHACDITPREIPRIYAAKETLLCQFDISAWEASDLLILETILTLFLCIKHRKPDVYAAYMSGKGEWDFYGWQSGYPQLYSFLSRFGQYRALLSDQCMREWTPLSDNRVKTSDDHYGVNFRVAFFGLAIIETKRGTDKKSLICVLHELLETIVI